MAQDPKWQGRKYGFLHISDCWSCLSSENPWIADKKNTWRENYPVKVAVLDSGIKRDHEAFTHIPDAEIQGKNLILGGTDDNIDDDDKNHKGHGTKCAAIIAGGCYMAEEYKEGVKKTEYKEGVQKSADPFEFWNGVTPFVNLYICKTKTIVAAIKHLLEEKKNNGLQVDVISCSKGNEKYNAALEKCIQEASLNNIIVVCAASNDGHKRSSTIRFPARFGHVICVGSHDYLGHASSFTPVGREIDILGPGEIKSACPVHAKPEVTNAVDEATGTSFAAPFVAGLVAIILANAQRIGGQDLRSAISNNVVMKQILREMASEPGDHTQSRGHGSLDPLRIFDFEDDFFRQIVESITLPPPPAPEPPSWSASSQAEDINTHETGDAAWVAATDDEDPWLMRDLGEVSGITGVITKGGIHDEYVTSYTISYGDENGDEKFYTQSDADGQHTVFPGNSDRDTKVINNFRNYSGPISARFIKIHPLKWQGHIAMQARIMTGGNHRLQEYDLRKVAIRFIPEDLRSAKKGILEIKHVTRPLKLLQEDVMFSSRMDSINLSLPEVAKVCKPSLPEVAKVCKPALQIPCRDFLTHQHICQEIEKGRSLNLEVFCTKIKREVTEISCLSLPSPSDAAYGDNKGSAALTEFLNQLGGGLVSSVQDLWLEGGTVGEEYLKFSDIKEILQRLQKLKSEDSGQLTVHCEKVDLLNVAADISYMSQINPKGLKVIIHQRDSDMSRHLAQNVTVTIPNFVTIEECSTECRPHCSSVSKQAASCNQAGIEEMVCDISLEKLAYASPDEVAAIHAPILKYKDKLKGNVHVTVAVLGSGIYIDHELDEDIKVTQIIKDKACFVPQESWDLSVDTHGTGTALASIATSFAPAQTRLLAAKVMDEQGRSNPAWVARAVDWAANHGTYPADVILIPVGFEKFDHRLYKAVTEAQKNGKIVIAAAACNTEAREISYPARHGDVICVGSHSRVGSHSSFGVKGREMDFLMMGEQRPVKAAPAKGSSKYSSVSGTSVAAAMATAVVGFTLLYAESVGGNNLRDQLKSNTMIRELLREACSSRGFHTPDRGYGTLDPDRLFKWGPQHFKELVKKITGKKKQDGPKKQFLHF